MTARLPLNALHVFCTVVQAGGVRPAAEQLCVTPGAVSRQLQALEAQLGATLFDRLPGRVSLTPAGERLHQRAAAPLALLAELLAGGPRRAARASLVRVDCGVTLAMHWLIPRLRCGQVFVNEIVKSDARVPFGGVKRSGYGRELGELGVKAFTSAKTVWVR